MPEADRTPRQAPEVSYIETGRATVRSPEAYVTAGTDQLEAFVNDPSSHAGAGELGTTPPTPEQIAARLAERVLDARAGASLTISTVEENAARAQANYDSAA